MTTVAIMPETSGKGVTYRAIAGNRQSVGSTVGEALDAITAQLSEEEAGTIVIVQNQSSDSLFPAEKKERLGFLMEEWRLARDRGASLPVEDQEELDSLVDEELRAAIARTKDMLPG